MGIAMRLPTCEEWDQFARVADEDDEVMHWDQMYSWCDDASPHELENRASRGYLSACGWCYHSETYWNGDLGLRPVIDLSTPDSLAPDGAECVMGTLYMAEQPVKVPQCPTRTGDVVSYIPGSKLELRPALDDPAYQMVGIKVGSIAIADRVMLKNISWEEAQGVMRGKQELMRLPTCEEWDRLTEIAGGNDELMHWNKMYSWCDDVATYDSIYRAIRGYGSVYDWIDYLASTRKADIGFRPVLDLPDGQGSDEAELVMGTLYMAGQPVRVPQDPTKDGDIVKYIPCTKLELREALPDPAYQMVGIKVGDVAIADRPMLKEISWDDIQTAVTLEREPAPVGIDMQILTREEWKAATADSGDDELHWQEMYSWCAGATLCGFISTGYECSADPACRADSIGFRPVVKAVSDSLVMGTLYMGGTPVLVPEHPTWDGDIECYIPGARLEIREALDDPAYQLMGVRAGDSLVADRPMLKQISLEDIEAAIG